MNSAFLSPWRLSKLIKLEKYSGHYEFSLTELKIFNFKSVPLMLELK